MYRHLFQCTSPYLNYKGGVQMGIPGYEFRSWKKYKILNLISLIRAEVPIFFQKIDF